MAKLLNFSRVNSACLNIHIPNQLLFHSVRLIRKAPIPLRTRAFPNYKNQKKRCVRKMNLNSIHHVLNILANPLFFLPLITPRVQFFRLLGVAWLFELVQRYSFLIICKIIVNYFSPVFLMSCNNHLLKSKSSYSSSDSFSICFLYSTI